MAEENRDIRLLIIAAYTSVRTGLHAMLSDSDGLNVVGFVSGSSELERALPTARPEVVVWDVGVEDQNRVIEILSQSTVGVVALDDPTGNLLARLSAEIPAWAILRKEADSEEIVSAVRAVAAGLIVLDRSFLSQFPASADLPVSPTEDESEDPLTAREHEVLQLMALGLPNKNIAARLGISLHTVKYHVAAILTKLDASSRTEAVTIGARRGYVLL